MSKQRFTQFATIGFIGFFLILALASLPNAGQAANTTEMTNQPQPVAAPTAVSAPAKATPTFNDTQPIIQPAPQPVPTPASAAAKSVIITTPSLLPLLLLGLLMGGTVVLLLGFVLRLRPRRSVCPTILAEGAHA